jgi:pre-mRNA cleavage complex 2 protein Pcf11
MSSDGDEVAEDYRLALEDLSSNMRFEISNLTVIARENTEHALAIAEVLQQHILKVGHSTIPFSPPYLGVTFEAMGPIFVAP